MSVDSTCAAAPPRDGPDRDPLKATVVRYEDSPDRCTVAPADARSDRQLTAWLSVNADALVALDEMR